MAPSRRSRSAQLPSETMHPAAATLPTQGATPGAEAARPERDAGLPALKRNGRRPAEKAIQELRALQAVTDTALSHLALDDLLHELQERVLAVMGVDSVAILLLEDDEQELTVRAARGLEEAVASQVKVPVGQGFAGRIVETRQPLIVDDLSTFPVAHLILRERLRSVAGVPLLVGRRLLGVVHVGSETPRHFTEAEVKLLEQVADRVALAIDRARLFEAEQAARRAAEREQIQWRAAMDSAPEFVITCDADLRVTYVNPAYARLRGGPADPSVSAEERPARYGLLDPDGVSLMPVKQLPLRRALQEGQPVHGVVLAHRDPAGEECLVAWDAAPMRSPQGALLGAIAVGRDITERSRLEREHAQQAEQLNRIFEGIEDGLVVYNAEGQIVRINAAARRLLGLDAVPAAYAQLQAADRAVMYEAYDEQGHRLAPEDWPLIQVLQGHGVTGPVGRDIVLRTLDAREVDLHTSAAPLRDGEGRLLGAVTILHDLTERKRLEQERQAALLASEAWFRTLADTAPVLVWVAGTDGLVTLVNAQWLQFSGRTLERELGNGWADRVHPDDYQGCLETYYSALRARERFMMEYRLRRFDGEYRWMVDSGVPRFAPDGTFLGYIGSAIDITERYRMEQEREEGRARELALQETTRRMDEFLDTAAHELRNPITAVRSHLQVAVRRFERATASSKTTSRDSEFQTLSEPLELANQSMERLVRLVALLFDVSRARSGTLDLRRTPCDLSALVREQVAAQQAATPERTLHLVVPDARPVGVLADADRLSQVLSNYLSNAVKYSPDDQPIEVRLEVVGGDARVAVRDAGPGLPEAEQRRVWEPYHRVPGVPAQGNMTGSLGLGLHISQRIVELHQGRVGVESEVGHGSTFWFTLPLAGASD